jgi:hypothetical protein
MKQFIIGDYIVVHAETPEEYPRLVRAEGEAW